MASASERLLALAKGASRRFMQDGFIYGERTGFMPYLAWSGGNPPSP